MNFKEFLAMKMTFESIELVERYVRGMVITKRALINRGLPEEVVNDLIKEVAEKWESRTENLTNKELAELLDQFICNECTVTLDVCTGELYNNYINSERRIAYENIYGVGKS